MNTVEAGGVLECFNNTGESMPSATTSYFLLWGFIPICLFLSNFTISWLSAAPATFSYSV
jgi:hypothetical protein